MLTKHVHFVYGVFDHLIATEVDATGSGSYNQIERYVLDISPEVPKAGVPGTALAQPLLKFGGAQNLTARYLEAIDRIFAEGAVVSLTQPDTVVFDLADNLGTVRDQVNTSGAPIKHSVFSSCGQDVYDSDPSVVHWGGFAGGHFDPATGFINDDHRWYDPLAVKWLSSDPRGFAAGDLNLSRYASNAPTVYIDATGLQDATPGLIDPSLLPRPIPMKEPLPGFPLLLPGPPYIIPPNSPYYTGVTDPGFPQLPNKIYVPGPLMVPPGQLLVPPPSPNSLIPSGMNPTDFAILLNKLNAPNGYMPLNLSLPEQPTPSIFTQQYWDNLTKLKGTLPVLNWPYQVGVKSVEIPLKIQNLLKDQSIYTGDWGVMIGGELKLSPTP